MPVDKTVGDDDRGVRRYAYPAELARFVLDRWSEIQGRGGMDDHVPHEQALNDFFSACYQASLLREEERPVTLRAILAQPALFPADGIPPESLQRLEFAKPLAFDATELRRLSVAADTQRTLVGVRHNANVLEIWGLVNSGTRWLRDVQGGRRAGVPLPPVPVVHVDAPGSMAVYKGDELIAKLKAGKLSESRADPFASEWLPQQFVAFRDELMQRHRTEANAARERLGEEWTTLEPTLLREISQRMMKRVIALLRDARHGGTIIFVPFERAEDLCTADPSIDLKYRFADDAPRRSFPDLVVRILNRLARIHAHDREHRREPVGWREFEVATDEELDIFDEALFDTAHLIAGLASADGAVVLSKQHDLLGFGGMISGRLPPVRIVARALDLEGDQVAEEYTDNVGTRHRSAYRLAGAMRDAVVIVISQDGGVRFVAQKNDHVTYWEQE